MWCKGKLFFADRQILAHIFAKRQKENPAPQGKTGLMKGGVVHTRIFSPMLYQLS